MSTLADQVGACRCAAPMALGRKAWLLFVGSDRGGERAAVFYSLIATAKLNDVDPRAWLADVLARIANHPIRRVDELLPWHGRTRAAVHSAAVAYGSPPRTKVRPLR